ncbi:MAG: glycosyltransferase 87 family protein [Pseudomonadota bacterium]
MRRRRGHPAWWIAGGLLAVQAAICALIILSGAALIDYMAYDLAAERLARGDSPYADPALVQTTFERMRDFLATRDPSVFRGDEEPTYIYPPTLALALAATGMAGTIGLQLAWLVLVVASIGAVAVFAARAGGSPWWALLPVLSLDAVAPLSSGNAELPVAALALLGCWLIWRGHGVLAALPIALAVLIKPVFGPLFAAFALLFLRQATDRRAAVTTVALAAGLSLALVALEVLRWPDWLRAETLDWLGNAYQHTFMGLPVERQVPFSDWNRAPMQVFLTAGLAPPQAQAAGLAVALTVLASGLLLAPRGLRFVPVMAVAWLVMLLARPTTWTLIHLDLLMLLALWPALDPGRPRQIALGAVVALQLSHWTAFYAGLAWHPRWMLTLQSHQFPFETLILLPAITLALLWALRQPENLDPAPGRALDPAGSPQ